MNQNLAKAIWAITIVVAAQGECVCAETSEPNKTTFLHVPHIVSAKLSVSGSNSKLVISMPLFRDDRPTAFRAKLFDVNRFLFYDQDGSALTPRDAAALTPKMTNVLLFEGLDGEFKGVQRSGALSGGGRLTVIDATESVGDRGSGGAIATVNGRGFEGNQDLFPTYHKAMDVRGWLGRDDQNKGFADPDRFGWLHYDLGTPQTLIGLRVWNYNYIKLIRRAVRDIDVYVSSDSNAYGNNDHVSWENTAELKDIPMGPGHLTKMPYGSNFEISSPLAARYIRLDIQRNWGNGFNTALAEVQFFGPPNAILVIVTPDKIIPTHPSAVVRSTADGK